MKAMTTKLAIGVLAAMAVSTGAMAQQQGYNYDAYCRQYADSQTVNMRQQATGDAVGSTLLGAALGAGVGAGGRGAYWAMHCW